ncbi:MAG: Flp family type IVb pilin [Pseudomonadota bacterium]
MAKVIDFIKVFVRDHSGISSVEYALLLALVASGIVIAALALGTSIASEFNEAADCVSQDLCT